MNVGRARRLTLAGNAPTRFTVNALSTIGLLALAFVAGCDRAAPKTPVVPSVIVGQAAPRYETQALDSTALSFGGASANVTLVNVWATWCASCREEFAELERLRGVHEAQGLRVVAISVDQGSDIKVRKFVAAQGSHFPVAHDREAHVSAIYGVRGLPATYLIGRDGTIEWTLTGSFLVDSAGLAKALTAALAH